MTSGTARDQALLDEDLRAHEIAAQLRQCVRVCCAASFICSYSSRRRTSSARGSPASSPVSAFLTGSSMRDLISISMAAISRYSAASSRLCDADLVDVLQVLQRDLRHRDVEDVEVLLADQVQQQVQRPFEGFEEDFQRIGRDVQVVRQRKQRLAVQARQCDVVDHVGRTVDAGVNQRRQIGRRCARTGHRAYLVW